MKYTFAASALAFSAVVAADTVVLEVRQNGNAVGQLSDKHEGAGINYFFNSQSGGRSYQFDPSTKKLTVPMGQYDGNFGAMGKFAAIGPAVTPVALTLDGDKITNYNFFLCNDVNDPYNYSKTQQILAVNDAGNSTAPFPNCQAVQLYKKAASSSSSSSASSAPITSTSTTTTGSVIWANTTITSYTTYCPESTVITITSCKDNACTAQPITVTTATTITCTACVVPPLLTTVTTQPTVAPTTPAPSSVAPTTLTSTTSAPSTSPSSAPSVTVTAGAAKNAMGLAGAVGLAALLL